MECSQQDETPRARPADAEPVDYDYEYAEGKQAEVEGFNTWQLRVTGNVQGVGYRDFARGVADDLLVRGFARNEPDGSVTVHMQHPQTRILELAVERLREGPTAAAVEEVLIEQIADAEPRDSFSVL